MIFKTTQKIFKEKYYSYIDDEFNHRDAGYWFMCNGSPKLHYRHRTIHISLGQRSTLDRLILGRQTEYFITSGRLARQTRDLMECATSRIDGLGLALWHHQRLLTWQQYPKTLGLGSYLRLVQMQRRCSQIRLFQLASTTRFFFKPIQDGMERPKTELSYKIPSKRLTRNSLKETGKEEEKMGEGLDTTIDWKNTGDNSYDGEKLQLLVHDESGKWERPDNILNNWRITKTCLRLGAKIVGKCMMGSTSNSLAKGGDNLKNYFIIQMSQIEIAMARLQVDYILCSYLWNGDTKGLLTSTDILSSTHHQSRLRN